MTSGLIDSHGRVVTDVRISVTDRCNFRCVYCMPEDWNEWAPGENLLTRDEILRLATILYGLGVKTIRVTGGEPLLRRDLAEIVSGLRAIDRSLDLAITTNGWFLREQAQKLKDAGLGRINVSLDTLDRDRFKQISRKDGLARVLDGLDAADEAGLAPVKINTVAVNGFNDDEIVGLVAWGISRSYQVRFIEFMPLEGGGAWSKDKVMTSKQILQRLNSEFEFAAAGGSESDPATRYEVVGGGSFGVIPTVSEPFCGTCDRIRITADGQLRNCLFALGHTDLRALLRGGSGDDEIAHAIRENVASKWAGHLVGSDDFQPPDRPMVAIGG